MLPSNDPTFRYIYYQLVSCESAAVEAEKIAKERAETMRAYRLAIDNRGMTMDHGMKLRRVLNKDPQNDDFIYFSFQLESKHVTESPRKLVDNWQNEEKRQHRELMASSSAEVLAEQAERGKYEVGSRIPGKSRSKAEAVSRFYSF
uniref:RGS domain-containing protein n=1 Tax=Panagrellus redivivus TaxID=6233 RepID=A0A7E4ZQK1_PANRE